jgi:hypothetical protein
LSSEITSKILVTNSTAMVVPKSRLLNTSRIGVAIKSGGDWGNGP